ncbi:MAG: glutamine amidotransferase [Acidobacteria bacterium]|nr:glutamine amidotransferase [Acidobacteriota bacterium]
MRFAVALPWWGYVLACAAALALAWVTYARTAIALSARQRARLIGLRAATLLLLVVFLLRPVRVVPAADVRDRVVPVLVDISRSMRLSDDGGPARIERAEAVARDLEQKLTRRFRVELYTFGEALARAESAPLAATARRSDLSEALSAVAERYRHQRLGGILVVSDGGDTANQEAGSAGRLPAPVYAVGVGKASGIRDREVVNLTVGEPVLADSSVDLSVSAVGSGYGREPVELRLSANGRPLEVRRFSSPADGAPVHEVFTVSPDSDNATVYTVQIPPVASEIAAENNTRSVLVPPQGRRRRVLIVEGAPGFEHTFLKRALALDPGLEVDSVVRKGQNDQGRDTFFVQAGASRAAALAVGYPIKRADLFRYDAIVFGNIEGEFFSRDQLDMTAAFVATRGGGLMVLGARSFERAGLMGTPLEEVLPLDLNDSGGAVARTAGSPPQNALALTDDGAAHPATRLAVSIDDSRKRWAQLPPLAATATLGEARPGAQVLAVAGSGAGEVRPIFAAQRYGQGRSMIFAGEAAWRWRMLLPAADRTYETVWRQAARWLSAGAPESALIAPMAVTLPGTTEAINVIVRDEEFKPVADAHVQIRVTPPGAQERVLSAALSDPREGRYTASARFDQAGVYRVEADVRRQGLPPVTLRRPMLVGGADVEMSEPHLNEAVLRRIAEATGGRYVGADAAGELLPLLEARLESDRPLEMRDLWNTGWSLAAVICLLTAEWIARRRVGLA